MSKQTELWFLTEVVLKAMASFHGHGPQNPMMIGATELKNSRVYAEHIAQQVLNAIRDKGGDQ